MATSELHVATHVQMLTSEGRSAASNAQPEAARGEECREDHTGGREDRFPAGPGRRGPHVEPAGALAEDQMW